jgi:hypothetical protein
MDGFLVILFTFLTKCCIDVDLKIDKLLGTTSVITLGPRLCDYYN